MVAGAKFLLASLGISHDTHQSCVVRSGRVREKCAETVRDSQGIQIKLTGGNPDNWTSCSDFIAIFGNYL